MGHKHNNDTFVQIKLTVIHNFRNLNSIKDITII